MNYEKLYNNLCNKNKKRVLVKERGFEIHHILPRSMGGSDDNSNLVKFTRKEHILAHKLLSKFTKGLDKLRMLQAYSFMSTAPQHPELPRHLVSECILPQSIRKENLFPISPFLHLVEREGGTKLSKSFFYNRKRPSGLLSLFDMFVFARKLGFNGIQSHYMIKKNRKAAYSVIMERDILDEGGLFTENFLSYCDSRYTTSFHKRFDILIKGTSNTVCLLTKMNTLNGGVLILPKLVSRGKVVLIKALPCTTNFEHMLYKVLSVSGVDKLIEEF